MKTLLLSFLFIIFTTSLFARSQYKVIGNDVIVNLEGYGAKSNLLKIEIWSESIIRVASTMKNEFIDYKGYIGERSNEKIKFKVAYAQTNIEITTSNLLINIEEDGMIRLLSRNGRKLLVESDRTYEASELDSSKIKITQSFYLNRNENIYGFGQKDAQNIYSLRNKSFDVIQNNTSIASPIFFSEKGFAFIWDNHSATSFDDAPRGLKLSSEIADEISYFVIYGPEWNSIISDIRSISGKAKLLPYWTYGYHLSPEAFDSKENLDLAISKYKSLKIPIEDKTVSNKYLAEEKKLTAEEKNKQFVNIWAFKNLKEKYLAENQNSTNERVIIPTHTNTIGIQHYSTFTKAGDITSSWESLNSQVSAGATSTLTGQPHWSTTIGGIKSFLNDDELMVRWFQFAAFTPVFQGPSISNTKWNITKIQDEALNAISKSIKLRYQLMPYIYSNAILNVTDDNSMMRSLLFDYQDDDGLNTVDQQYLFGQSLMVCPVTTKAAKQIKVTLPASSNWFNFWTGKLQTGGLEFNVDVTLDHIPLFVKQGSIIPIIQNTDSLNAPIEIRVYGGADAEFTLYEDEKDGFGYLNELSSSINFEYNNKNSQLTISTKEGEFPFMQTAYYFKIVLVSETDGIGNLASENVQDIVYKGKRLRVRFE